MPRGIHPLYAPGTEIPQKPPANTPSDIDFKTPQPQHPIQIHLDIHAHTHITGHKHARQAQITHTESFTQLESNNDADHQPIRMTARRRRSAASLRHSQHRDYGLDDHLS